jgi:hypothetical protein
MIDNLTVCSKCGSNACYHTQINTPNPDYPSLNSYWCYGCGFISNDLLTKDSEYYTAQTELFPELYKDLIYEDESGKCWIPSNVNIPDKGMVFINGTSIYDWKWAGVKAVKISEEEKHKFPIPKKPGEFYEWRMDMSTLKSFDSQDYMDALSYIEIIPE